MNATLAIFAATAGLAALTWFSYRSGQDQMVSRDRTPRLFKVNIGLNILLVILGLVGGIASLLFRAR
jgi:hypothetical protein